MRNLTTLRDLGQRALDGDFVALRRLTEILVPPTSERCAEEWPSLLIVLSEKLWDDQARALLRQAVGGEEKGFESLAAHLRDGNTDTKEVGVLLAKAMTGSQNAWARFFELVEPNVKALAARMLSGSAEQGIASPSDVVQGVFGKFVSKGVGLADLDNPLAYIRRMANTYVIDICRQEKVRRYGRERSKEAVLNVVPSRGRTPSSITVGATVEQDLVSVLQQVLPTNEFEVIYGTIFLSETTQEIAERLGYTERHVRRLLKEGLGRLRKLLESNADDSQEVEGVSPELLQVLRALLGI
jgi:RNA polymerase sigma factor (sigma-70 family)